jgi:maleylacetate reductase
VRDFSYAQRDLEVVFGDGALARLPEAINATFAAVRLLLVSTPGRSAIAEAARLSLDGRVAAVFTDARAHVPAAVVAEALDRARTSRCDGVLAIGGGSAIGLGKAVVKETGTPLVAVPTTYSGSEMTDIWGVTHGKRKQTGRDRRVAPRLVVYDPRLTYTMPPEATAASGMNAIAHSVEALYSTDASPVSNLVAADGIRRLAASLATLASDPADPAARSEALCGAHLCGRALDMTSMGLHHKLCHALGGSAGLPHALTHAVVLPYATAYNAAAAPNAMAMIASGLGAASAARGLWELNRMIGITQTLGDLGLQAGDVDRVVAEVTERPYPNPAAVTADGVRKLIEGAVSGAPPGPAR